MDLNDLNKVWEIKPLKKVREDEAREILERVAKQVQPIMRKRKWKVKVLSEFCPSNPSLLWLNIGGGVEVKLRLRRPNNEWDFFPYDLILNTMLHELCHNEHGPHNADFYKLLDELRKQALAAAEKRSRSEALLPHGHIRLGGDSSIKTVPSPVQAAAMAAERRLHDDLWCGSKSLEHQGPSETTTGSLDQRALIWEACGTPNSKCNGATKFKVWSCKFCSLDNSTEIARCVACGEWRYSYGPPTITPGT
ncbi:hypothetical protein SASPL_109971 [Salvia splendens]|uniref:WLM domain-containing protein n=1 Tax=Salvia splendens TaxID=180675 RepID=A0A8X8Y812_SALSN|nr:hypothetical protein SASPL_109971 [Salvia splendens]